MDLNLNLLKKIIKLFQTKNPNSCKNNYFAFFIYLIIFLIVFLKFPLSQELPGNSTTWLAIAISRAYVHYFSQLLNGETLTTFLFPIKNVFAFGQGAPFIAIGFLTLKGLLGNEFWAYYFSICGIFSLSAWGLFYLAKSLNIKFLPALMAGLFFTFSNFTFANIDDPHEVFFLFPALMISFLFKFKNTGVKRNFYFALFFASLEIWSSVYIFFFQTFFLLPFIISLLKNKSLPVVTLFKGFLLFLFISLPVLAFHFYGYLTLDVINPFDPMAVVRDCSLKWIDFFSPLKNNLLYGGRVQDFNNPIFWSFIRRHAFLGSLFLIFGILGMFKFKKNFPELFWMAIISFVFSLGPLWEMGKETVIPSPFFWFYDNVPLFIFLRVPLRAFFFTSLALCVFVSLLFNELMVQRRIKGIQFLFIAFIFFHLLENFPFPLQGFPAEKLISPNNTLLNFFKGKKNEVILDLPQKLGIEFDKSQDPIFSYNREILYMNWQTHHLQNIIGGVHAYWPKSRVDIQNTVDAIPNLQAISKLKTLGVTKIVFHKDLTFKDEMEVFKKIKTSNLIKLEYEDEKLAIFSFAIL